MRLNTPPVVPSRISSSSSTARTLTTAPDFLVIFTLITPMPPRLLMGYCPIGVRLPRPSSVTVSRLRPSLASATPTTASPVRSRIPRTPRAPRPISRTCPALKRTALPCCVASTICVSFEINLTPTRLSARSSVMAKMPARLALMNSIRPVRLTIPRWVTMKTLPASSNERRPIMALMRSPWASASRFTIAVPRAVRPASGTSCAFIRYTFPRSEKNSRKAWLVVVSTCSTKSSSFVATPMTPRVPRRCNL